LSKYIRQIRAPNRKTKAIRRKRTVQKIRLIKEDAVAPGLLPVSEIAITDPTEETAEEGKEMAEMKKNEIPESGSRILTLEKL
jgi:hypothetical protein